MSQGECSAKSSLSDRRHHVDKKLVGSIYSHALKCYFYGFTAFLAAQIDLFIELMIQWLNVIAPRK